MIDIKAKLMRSIYVTGELVECLIEFTHIIPGSAASCLDDNGNADTELVQNLAWASVQLHCYRKTSYSAKVADKAAELAELIGKTTLDAVTQAPGDVVIATKPKILFCDLKLSRGESKIYLFNEFVPRDGPPTYRGHDIKYFYKITIATQRVKSKVQTLTIPIRVLPIPRMIDGVNDVPCTEETNEELTPTNPFLEKREISELEISWYHIKNKTARRAPKYYRISNKHGMVGRFCLFKPSYKLGEDIVGSLDFRNCQVKCVQFCVKLQSEEFAVSKKECANASNSGFDMNDSSSIKSFDVASVASGIEADKMHKSATSGSQQKDNDECPTGKLSTFSTSHQICYSMNQTHLVVPIPLHVTPTFSSDLVQVKWRLHFEFVTSKMMDFGKPIPEEGELKAPAEIPVETMVWNLPITLYTANPLQIYAPSQDHHLLIK